MTRSSTSLLSHSLHANALSTSTSVVMAPRDDSLKRDAKNGKNLQLCNLEIRMADSSMSDWELDKRTIVLKATVDRLTSEVIKELKQTLKGVIPSKPMQVPIHARPGQNSSFTSGRPSTASTSSILSKQDQDQDRTELDLFLFNTSTQKH